jgi:hypothetical protein
MTAFDSFPLGKPAFVSDILDRAAYLRCDDAKLLALESHRDTRAYVVYRDSLVLAQEADGPRALLSIDEALKEITACDKLNIAALGNLVPQLHVHVIARRSNDAAWPRPVWGVMPPLAHDAEEVQNFINALRRKIWLG